MSATGFYLRKYFNATPAASTGVGSDMWWVRFRLGEIYFNAAEAAFELGLHAEALGYINTLRERAGFPPNSLTSLTHGKIRSERWAELAFEDHRVWDLRRWRIAHLLWEGAHESTTANLYGLYPYRIIRPRTSSPWQVRLRQVQGGEADASALLPHGELLFGDRRQRPEQ